MRVWFGLLVGHLWVVLFILRAHGLQVAFAVCHEVTPTLLGMQASFMQGVSAFAISGCPSPRALRDRSHTGLWWTYVTFVEMRIATIGGG